MGLGEHHRHAAAGLDRTALGARSLPRTFIDLTAPKNAGTVPASERARQEGIKMLEIATGHDAMVSAPVELAALLDEIVRSQA